jgi:hypothetical protein
MAARFTPPRPLPGPDEPGAQALPGDPAVPPRAPLGPAWRHSSFSTGADTTCVEVALDGGDGDDRAVLLRDSKDPAGPVLRFTAAEWRVFLFGVLAGDFELPEPGHRSSSNRAASSADDA